MRAKSRCGVTGGHVALPPYILGELERCMADRGISLSEGGGWREGGGKEVEGGGGGNPEVAGQEAGEAFRSANVLHLYTSADLRL